MNKIVRHNRRDSKSFYCFNLGFVVFFLLFFSVSSNGQSEIDRLFELVSKDWAGKVYTLAKVDSGNKIDTTVIIIPKRINSIFIDTLYDQDSFDSIKLATPSQVILKPYKPRDLSFSKKVEDDKLKNYSFAIIEIPSQSYYAKDYKVIDEQRNVLEVSCPYILFKPPLELPMRSGKK